MKDNGSAARAGSLDPVTRLLAVEEIRTLRAKYWRFVDTKQWAAFGRLFALDARFVDHSAEFRCDGAEEIEGKISAVLEHSVTIHHGHQSEIEIEDESNARGIWAMEDYLVFPPGVAHETNPYPSAVVRGYGHYVDRYVKLDGEWRFQQVDLHRLRLEVLSPSSTDYPAELGLEDPAAV